MADLFGTGLSWLGLGYLLGSFPSAYLASRLVGGRDIRRVGSGNVGGMNAFRNVSPVAGVLTAVGDIGKGALAVWLASRYGAHLSAWEPLAGAADLLTGSSAWPPLAAMAGVVIGHNWMLFLGLKGGKGLGATVGALAVLKPLLIPVFLVLILGAAALIRDTNVGAGLAAGALPLVFWWAGAGDPAWVTAGLVLAVAIVAKHWPDFRAYRAGRRQMV